MRGLTEDGARRKWQRDFADVRNIRRDQVQALDANGNNSGRLVSCFNFMFVGCCVGQWSVIGVLIHAQTTLCHELRAISSKDDFLV